MTTKRILVADEEEQTRDVLRDVLQSRGYEVTLCTSGESAVQSTAESPIFATFLDLCLPGMDGIETLRQIRALRPETKVVIVTGYSRSKDVGEALNMGCFVCMMKPVRASDILGILDVLEAGINPLALAA